jgi:uncharacterized protein YciI
MESGTFWAGYSGGEQSRTVIAVTSLADARAWAEVARTKLSGGA